MPRCIEVVMMETQESGSGSKAVSQALELASGEVMALGKSGGQITVVSGRVWLTRSGDLGDHVLGAGEVLHVGSGGALVESWSRSAPASIEWRRHTLLQRLRTRFDGGCERCWALMHPGGRIGIGTAAAVAAIAVAGALFGPVSESRVRALSQPSQTPSSVPVPHKPLDVELA